MATDGYRVTVADTNFHDAWPAANKPFWSGIAKGSGTTGITARATFQDGSTRLYEGHDGQDLILVGNSANNKITLVELKALSVAGVITFNPMQLNNPSFT